MNRYWADHHMSPQILAHALRRAGLEPYVEHARPVIVAADEHNHDVLRATFDPRTGALLRAVARPRLAPSDLRQRRATVLTFPQPGTAPVSSRERLDNLIAWLDAGRPQTWEWKTPLLFEPQEPLA